MMIEKIIAYGHFNVQCNHKSTIEITKENYLTKNGDCIIGINSNKSCNDLAPETKNLLRSTKKFEIEIICDGVKDRFEGSGDIELILSDMDDIVFRKSNYICGRTIMINCSKAAIDLKRPLIQKMQDPDQKLEIVIKLLES